MASTEQSDMPDMLVTGPESISKISPSANSADPLVTFVVPCYKLAHLLPECVNSILSQSYNNFEILIMDNCSPDNTPEVAASFQDSRVKHVRNEINIGHLRNFNKGVSMAAGKYVWLLSADDSLTSRDVLNRFVTVMERNPRAGYVFCRAHAVKGKRDVGVAKWTDCGDQDRVWDGLTFLKRLVEQNCIVMSALMARRECYEKVSMFALDLPHATDWYLWCMFALHYDVAYISQPMATFRLHEESLTSQFNKDSSPVCLIDELNVLWRVAREAELVRKVSIREECNASISLLAAVGREPSPKRTPRPGLGESEFNELVRRNAKDQNDEKDIQARVYAVLGDERYWCGRYRASADAYWTSLKFHPWSARTWAKYLLGRAGKVGNAVRQGLTSLAMATGLKQSPYPDRGYSRESQPKDTSSAFVE
jgi:glycosyltransferase involved in cell wall biosynthesis